MARRPKRQHHVPRGYLQRFARDDQVIVRRRDGKTFVTNTLNVAVEAGFYDVVAPDGGTSSIVEETLAVVETFAMAAIAAIDGTSVPPSRDTNDRSEIATFIAAQMTRTTWHRERIQFPQRVATWAGDREITQALVAEYLEQEHLGHRPQGREPEAAFAYISEWLKEPSVAGPEFAIMAMLNLIPELVPRILDLNWTIEIDRRHELITSDVPVVVWRKPSRRDAYMGFGIVDAEELRLPLDPGKQLVLSRRVRDEQVAIAVHRVRRCNDDMAAGSHRFIVGRPDQGAELGRVRLARRRPVLRFDLRPLLSPDGQRVSDGEVLHMWTPRGSQSPRSRKRTEAPPRETSPE